METNIIAVSSDHADPSQLDTTSPAGTNQQPAVFVLNGYANIDPLQVPNAAAPVNEHSVMCIPAWRSGVQFISQTIGGLPKHVYQKTANGPVRLDNHPAEWTLNQQPNELQTPATFWSTFLLHAVNWSNGYAALKMIGSNDPKLYILPPDRMTAFRFNGQQFYAFDTEDGSREQRYLIFGADEMLHLPALSFDGMSGLPMVKMLAGTFRTIKNMEAYVSNYYANGGLLGGSIETDKPLTPEQIKDIGNTITNKFSGADKAHKWIVLANGAKAKTLAPQMDTDQVEENRTFKTIEICQALRLPPHCLYELDRATWANIQSLGIELVVYSLVNWIRPLEQELSRKLLTTAERKSGMYIKFDTAELIRGDMASQVDIAVKRLQNAITTPDEERAALLELPPYPDEIGAKPSRPANTITLGAAPTPSAAPGTPQTAPETPPALPATPTAPITPPAVEIEGSDLAKAAKPAEQFAVKAHIKLTHFSAMIDDVAKRVHNKTEKAVDAARKKHADNPAGFTTFANVFVNDQTHFAAEAVRPVFTTYRNLSGKPVDGMADKCGTDYGKQLATHLNKMSRNEDSPAPDLAQIVLSTEEDNED